MPADWTNREKSRATAGWICNASVITGKAMAPPPSHVIPKKGRKQNLVSKMGHQVVCKVGHQVVSKVGHQVVSKVGHRVVSKVGHQVVCNVGHQSGLQCGSSSD